MEFKDRLKALREEKRWSQDELADRLQITKSAVSTYERGKNHPRFAVLDQMADVFDVDINYLLGNSNQRGSYPSHDDALVEVKTAKQPGAEAAKRWFDKAKGYGFIEDVDSSYEQWLEKGPSKRGEQVLEWHTTEIKPHPPAARDDLVQVVNSYTEASPEVKQAVRAILGIK